MRRDNKEFGPLFFVWHCNKENAQLFGNCLVISVCARGWRRMIDFWHHNRSTTFEDDDTGNVKLI